MHLLMAMERVNQVDVWIISMTRFDMIPDSGHPS